LDDFLSEAKEVYSVNSWINYALPLHRIRESGYRHYLLDLIDERPLTVGELKEFCSLLFGDLNLPNPETNWGDFANYLRKIVQQESCQWNPMRRKLLPWVDISKLNHIYGRDRAGYSSGIWLWVLVLSTVWVLVWVLKAIQLKILNFTYYVVATSLFFAGIYVNGFLVHSNRSPPTRHCMVASKHSSSEEAVHVSSDYVSYVTRRGNGSTGGGGLPMPRSKELQKVDDERSHDDISADDHLVRPKVGAEMPKGRPQLKILNFT